MPTNNPVFVLNGRAGVTVALLLLAMLAMREVARVSTRPRWQALARALSVVITPILIIFVATVTIFIMQAFH